ncbi:MAG: hypothetical protein Q8J76_08675, partial [Desulfobulbaceae bacterium]|nr:hypothetical protein [Desulfobulbaceae bacterium]
MVLRDSFQRTFKWCVEQQVASADSDIPATRHGIAGIGAKIDQYLFELMGISRYLKVIFSKVEGVMEAFVDQAFEDV